MSGIPGRYADQFNLRLPDGMRDRLAEAAKANKRSMNAEIVSRLEATFQASSDQAAPVAAERVVMMIRATAASATMDAAAAAQRVFEDGGAELPSRDLYDRIAEKLGELIGMKVSALRETAAFQAIPATRVEQPQPD